MAQLLLLALLALPPADDEEPFEPPRLKKPDNFRGAVGLFRLQTSATPTRVPVRQSIRFVITLTADESVPVLKPPTRPELEKFSEFQEFRARFDIETPEPTQRQTGKKWEFYYLLKPRSEKIDEVPEVSFSFFNPTFGQDPRGYQEAFADPIPITVEPAQVEKAPVDGGGLKLGPFPASVWRLPEDDDSILERHRPWAPPSSGWLLVFLLGPPAAGLTWLITWRRLYPDAARRAGLRRSRAARSALAALDRARKAETDRMAEQVSGIVAGYLHERLDLHSATPTPGEIEAFLRGLGIPDSLREKTSALFQTCDALRFSSVPPAVSGGLAGEAEEVILALEEQTWSSLRS